MTREPAAGPRKPIDDIADDIEDAAIGLRSAVYGRRDILQEIKKLREHIVRLEIFLP